MNLTFRQLQTFIEVMRAGSVSEAGRTLGRTQPAISAAIASLEEEIGFKLFERERSRLVPKPEAHYFLEEAEFVLSRLSQSARTMREIGNLKRGRLRIACHPAASGFFMPKVVSGFLQDKPEVSVSLMMHSSPIVAEWIASQQYDVGLAETPPPRHTVNAQHFDLPHVCAMPASDPLADRPEITPGDLDGKPMAMLFEEHHTYTATRAYFESQGARLNQRFELRTFLPALQLVQEGLCYCICDRINEASYKLYSTGVPGLVFRPFSPEISLSISVLTPANRPLSMLATAFSASLKSEIEKLISESA